MKLGRFLYLRRLRDDRVEWNSVRRGCWNSFCAAALTAVSLLLTHGAVGANAQEKLSLRPESVDFGMVSVGRSRANSTTIENRGSSTIVLSKESVEGTGFSLIGFDQPKTLEVGEQTAVIVRFTPLGPGESTGAIVFGTDSAASRVMIPLQGTGVEPTGPEGAQTGPDVQREGLVSVSQMAGTPVLPVTAILDATPTEGRVETGAGSEQAMTNSALASGVRRSQAIVKAAAMAVSSTQGSIRLVQHASTDNGASRTSNVVVTLTGVASGDLLTCSLSYGSSAAIALSVRDTLNGAWLVANAAHFDASNTQTTGQFYLANSTAGNVTITGTPAIANGYGAMNCQEWSGVATTNPLDQATQQDGSTGNASSGSVTTASGGELVLGDLENIQGPGAGSGFALINSAPTTWLTTEYQIQGSAGPVASTWTAGAGTWTAQVAAFRPANGSATGTGEPPNLSATPTSAVFTGVPIGTTMTQTIRLMNSGSAAAVITAVGTQGAGFATTGLTVPLNLAAGATSTFNATYLPASTGTVGGLLTLSVKGSTPSLTIPLVGSGVAATRILAASPTTIAFGSVGTGGVTTTSVTLTNSGNSSLTLRGITVTGTGFSATGIASGTSLAPGQAAVLSVKFAPATTGAVSGSLAITSNATNSSPVTISLTGTGGNSSFVQLSWTRSVSSGIAGYNVYRSSSTGGAYSKLVSSPVTGTSYTDQTVQPGDEYYYVVTTVATNGQESAYSSQVAASIP